MILQHSDRLQHKAAIALSTSSLILFHETLNHTRTNEEPAAVVNVHWMRLLDDAEVCNAINQLSNEHKFRYSIKIVIYDRQIYH